MDSKSDTQRYNKQLVISQLPAVPLEEGIL